MAGPRPAGPDNLRALHLGRHLAHDPATVQAAVGGFRQPSTCAAIHAGKTEPLARSLRGTRRSLACRSLVETTVPHLPADDRLRGVSGRRER